MFATLFLISAVLVLISLPGISAVFRRAGIVDAPGHRKIHVSITPKSGGAAVWFVTLLLLPFCAPSLSAETGAALVAVTLFFLLGLLNDYREQGPWLRYACELLIVVGFGLYAGYKIHELGDLLGFGPITLGVFAYPFTAFAVASLTNGFNMLDGVDGLLASIALPMVLVLIVIARYAGGGADVIGILSVFAGGLAGFAVHNMQLLGRLSARTFLGDAGSLLIGAAVCYALLGFSQLGEPLIRPIDAVWIAGLPIMETVNVVITRGFRGQSIFTAGKDHVHHLLLDKGWSHVKIALGLGALSAIFALTGLMGALMQWNEAGLCAGFVLCAVSYRMTLRTMWKQAISASDEPGQLIVTKGQ